MNANEAVPIDAASISGSSSDSSMSGSSIDQNDYASSASSVSSGASLTFEQNAKEIDGYTTCYPHSTSFQLGEHAIDDIRPLKVAVVGAGLSGLMAGALLPVKVPGIQLVIFDKNDDVGGTWHEHRYPGVRCDIPSHVYQSSFSPNTQWSEEYTTGPEIRRYWQDFAKKYDVYSKLRLWTKVIGS
ncbi:uncharacterized protein LTR77_007525 [Saxophila tyrrhenica]|uniref:Flavin-containing monooxygenase n=1 Tax=Saxophila tyrrhenica TaxID=1690608 RepID=A0AAV9P6Y6_9PEZI|nr:hypothetical protein LTR77_007525 [Saxophila tyrrhenica]